MSGWWHDLVNDGSGPTTYLERGGSPMVVGSP